MPPDQVLDFGLSHTNSAVVMATVKLFLNHTAAFPDQQSQVLGRVRDALLTLVSGREHEVVYAALSNTLVLAKRHPDAFAPVGPGMSTGIRMVTLSLVRDPQVVEGLPSVLASWTLMEVLTAWYDLALSDQSNPHSLPSCHRPPHEYSCPLLSHLSPSPEAGLQPSHPVQLFTDFYCRYQDPSYLKALKIDMLVAVTDASNAYDIAEELSQYIRDVDEQLARQAIRAVAAIALKVGRLCLARGKESWAVGGGGQARGGCWERLIASEHAPYHRGERAQGLRCRLGSGPRVACNLPWSTLSVVHIPTTSPPLFPMHTFSSPGAGGQWHPGSVAALPGLRKGLRHCRDLGPDGGGTAALPRRGGGLCRLHRGSQPRGGWMFEEDGGSVSWRGIAARPPSRAVSFPRAIRS